MMLPLTLSSPSLSSGSGSTMMMSGPVDAGPSSPQAIKEIVKNSKRSKRFIILDDFFNNFHAIVNKRYSKVTRIFLE
jgi:hypothetical protein